MKPSILITGAAGFIGAHTARALKLAGEEIVAIDSFSNYYSTELKDLRVADLLSPLGVKVEKCDISDSVALEKTLSGKNISSIIHLAAQPGIRLPVERYGQYISANIDAYLNIFTWGLKNEIDRITYASSSSVYGNYPKAPFSESFTDIKPISFYGATKLANESMAPTIIRKSKMKARGLRFFTVYGSWGRPDMAYFRIAANLISGKPFNLFGDGDALRDFSYVDDTVKAIIALHEELASRPAEYHDIVNTGGGIPRTLAEMINIAETQLGNELQSNKSAKHPSDVERTFADATYLHSLIGKNVPTSLEVGMSEVIKWAQDPQVSSLLPSWTETTV
ncbi:NAD-dependent epimerase [Actinomycetes bacterium]|nr:NAD-dependent epimerase [Actinomycetes bacterium]